MYKRFLTLAVLTLVMAGCPDDPAPTTRIDIHANQAIKDWKAAGNPWHQVCSPYLVYLHFVPQDNLPAICGVDAQLYGCLDGFDIFVAQEIKDTVRTDYVVEHELRHWLSGCEFASIDGDHNDPRVWYPYRGVSIRE